VTDSTFTEGGNQKIYCCEGSQEVSGRPLARQGAALESGECSGGGLSEYAVSCTEFSIL